MTTYNATPSNVTTQLTLLRAGDTLLLGDGTYAPFEVDNMPGTIGSPITIRAANDGKAIVDGTGRDLGLAGGVWLRNCTYTSLEGVDVHHISSTFRDVSGIYVDGGDHCTLRRCTAHDIRGGNNNQGMVFGYGANYGLAEDCATWEGGRYGFGVYESNFCTLRRFWAHRPRTDNCAFAPRCGWNTYGSHDTTLENCVAQGIPIIDYQPGGTTPEISGGVFMTSGDTVNFPNYNTVHDSCIFVDCESAGPQVSGNVTGAGTVFTNCFTRNPLYPGDTVGSSLGIVGVGYLDGAPTTVSFDRCTASECYQGIYHYFYGNTTNLAHCAFDANTVAVFEDAGGAVSTYSNYSGNGSGSLTGGNNSIITPGYNTATYGAKGGRLIRPAAFKNAASDGGDIGCEILYQVVNSVTTSIPLWPWPMEDRIMAGTTASYGLGNGVSPTYAANGGMFTTLSGLYGAAAATRRRGVMWMSN